MPKFVLELLKDTGIIIDISLSQDQIFDSILLH